MSAIDQEKLQAVIFDWAGTTVDFGSRAPALAFVEIFRRSGVPIEMAEARGPMGKAKRDHIASILFLDRVAEAWSRHFGSAPTEQDIDRLYSEFLPLQKETLAHHSALIPGATEAVAACRERGMKIGSSTGYTRELMEVVIPIAAAGGYEPDAVMCADDASVGRPAPWLIYRNAEQLGVYPMKTIIKVDDTPIGILAGRNAGTWTVGITRTGNALGLSQEEAAALPSQELKDRLATAVESFRSAGAHYVIESVAELPSLLSQIEQQLARGITP